MGSKALPEPKSATFDGPRALTRSEIASLRQEMKRDAEVLQRMFARQRRTRISARDDENPGSTPEA